MSLHSVENTSYSELLCTSQSANFNSMVYMQVLLSQVVSCTINFVTAFCECDFIHVMITVLKDETSASGEL
jgi:hypothetical protein